MDFDGGVIVECVVEDKVWVGEVQQCGIGFLVE